MRGAWAAAVLGLATCGEPEFVCPEELPGAAVPEHLCTWGLFEGAGATQEPAEDVHAYGVISELFTDHATKWRFLRLPPGGAIAYSPTEVWEFPVGTVFAKSFGYPVDARDPSLGHRMIETRLMVREASGWEVHVYKWNDAQTDALRFVPGTRLRVPWIDADGVEQDQEYRIPSTEDCKICHGGKEEVGVLGLRTRQLARAFDFGAGPIDQVDHFAALGLFDRAPEPPDARQRLADPFGEGDVVARARAYLDGNCAYCHREGGDAQSSGLWLNLENEDELHLGVCKVPVAAGAGSGNLDYDIVPGDPDASIMVFRMEHTDADIKMPERGGLMNDAAGTAVIRAWIAQMQPPGCGADN